MESHSEPGSDSGVSSVSPPPSEPEVSAQPSKETPIEREIREAAEREQNFRRSRGLETGVECQELVEITMKSVLLQPLPAPKAKERGQRAGSQMQREIRLESKREQDLVSLGMVSGKYDRGESRELEEKRRVFESTLPGLIKAKANAKNPVYNGATDQTVIIMESSNFFRPTSHLHHLPNAQARSEELLTEPGVFRGPGKYPDAPNPNSLSPAKNPFFPLRRNSHSVLEEEIRLAQERERALRKQRYSIYGSQLASAKEFIPSWTQCVNGTEKPNLGKLQISWPPTQPNLDMNRKTHSNRPQKTHGQTNSLLQRWEAGILGNCQDE
uniref:A-kinase anchor protein 2 C-terminal domain-containing protein n=1 Tax=Callorhinchus milii TaxID=7868 RepID=V9L175_CALMI